MLGLGSPIAGALVGAVSHGRLRSACRTLSTTFLPLLPLLLLGWGWGPWDDPSGVKNPKSGTERRDTRALGGGVPLLFVRFYSNYISPIDGPTCIFTPTCASYAIQAIRKHGPILGWIMGCERSMRYHKDMHYYPRIYAGNRLHLYDPVEANDFWFGGTGGR